MSEEGHVATQGNRILFLDNLRTFMIFLVLLYHAGLVYESSGIVAFFWIVDDPVVNDLSGIINIIMDTFIMATIFFVSGFFAPVSTRGKSGWAFLKSRLKRLMIPWVVAVLTLIPLYKVIFLYSRNLPQESWTTYFHFSNGIFSQNWLWFLPALFLFDVLYLFLSRVNMSTPAVTLKWAVAAIFLVGLTYSLCMDVFGGRGWTKTILIDFQNERLLIYFMFFLLGSLCYKLKTFESPPKSKRLYVVVNCIAWIPINIYLFLLIYSLVKPGEYLFSEIFDSLLLWVDFHLSMLCLLYVAVSTFRFYLNKQRRLGEELGKNSYGVYVIHVIVMGAIALPMLGTAIPSLLKQLILVLSTYAASNLLVYLYRKIKPYSLIFSASAH